MRLSVIEKVLKELRSIRRDQKKRLEVIHCEMHDLKGEIMSTKQEVLDAIAQEKAEVVRQIQELRDQVAGGTPATAEDFNEIIAAVKGIVEDELPEEPA